MTPPNPSPITPDSPIDLEAFGGVTILWGEDRERHLLQHGVPQPTKEVPTLQQVAPRFLDGYARANRQKTKRGRSERDDHPSTSDAFTRCKDAERDYQRGRAAIEASTAAEGSKDRQQ